MTNVSQHLISGMFHEVCLLSNNTKHSIPQVPCRGLHQASAYSHVRWHDFILHQEK